MWPPAVVGSLTCSNRETAQNLMYLIDLLSHVSNVGWFLKCVSLI